MKFTPEEIANYRELIRNVEETEVVAKQAATSGLYHGAAREAAIARLELKRIASATFPAALDEIERLREALRVTQSKLLVSSGAIILVKETHPELFCDELLANAMNIALEGGE